MRSQRVKVTRTAPTRGLSRWAAGAIGATSDRQATEGSGRPRFSPGVSHLASGAQRASGRELAMPRGVAVGRSRGVVEEGRRKVRTHTGRDGWLGHPWVSRCRRRQGWGSRRPPSVTQASPSCARNIPEVAGFKTGARSACQDRCDPGKRRYANSASTTQGPTYTRRSQKMDGIVRRQVTPQLCTRSCCVADLRAFWARNLTT